MKTCSKCKQNKQLSEFYKNRSKNDGLQDDCKICGAISQKRYLQTHKGKATKKRYRQSEKGEISQERFYSHNPNYIKSKSAVNNAVRYGKLTSPKYLFCHYCAKPAHQYHHYKGYEPKNWLKVIPVCIICHQKCRKIA